MAKKLIVIEGIDGSGKETQTKLLKEYYKDSFTYLRFPDYDSKSSSLVKMYLNGDFGKDANKVNPYAASSFYAIDRFASYTTQWKNITDKHILADRYVTANMIFQASKTDGKERLELLKWIDDFEYNKLGLPRPDLVIFLDVPLEICLNVIKSRDNKIDGSTKKDIHENNVEYLKRCYETAQLAADMFNWKRIIGGDENGFLPAEKIHNNIKKAISNIL